MEDYCILSEVEFVDVDSVTCSFVCKVCTVVCSPNCSLSFCYIQTHFHVMQVDVPQVPCPGQCLHMLTTAENNKSVHGAFSTTSAVCFDTKKATVVINAAGLPAGEYYHSNFSIKDGDTCSAVIDRGEESVSSSECN